jgi:putative tryptophan/tyrosine transport system substrate-binding protein
MFYGNDSSETYRLSAWYIDRILRGARPGELPVQQATKYLLAINLRAARAIGLTIPPDLLIQADRVFD